MLIRITLVGVFLLFSWTHAADVTGGASSAEELFKQVLVGLEARDEQRLKQFVVNEAEFKKYLWPMLETGVTSVRKVKSEEYFEGKSGTS
jgi:hypothetical protein